MKEREIVYILTSFIPLAIRVNKRILVADIEKYNILGWGTILIDDDDVESRIDGNYVDDNIIVIGNDGIGVDGDI